MRTLLPILLLAAGTALATAVIGWIAVPVLGAVAGLVLRGRPHAPLLAATGALTGWAALLVLGALRGPTIDLARQIGAVMQVPWLVVVLVTLLFPAVLAWSAARVAQGVATPLFARRAGAAAVAADPVLQTERASS